MFKRLMSLGLLCLAFDASASINVTTTADENGTNASACSLREAIAIINSSDLSQGFGGCENKDSSKVIVLNANSTFPLSTELTINKNVTIQSSSSGDLFNFTDGSDNPVLRAVGNHRVINILATATTTPTVTFTNVNFKGCGISTGCETQGGVIINQGTLELSGLRIVDGVAERGGAIYNENVGKLTITNVELRNNTASARGAAIYSIQPAFTINRTLMRENKIASVSGAGFVIDTEKNDVAIGKVVSTITASTIYNNKASAIKIVPGIGVSSVTIIGNQGGVTLNAPPLVVTTPGTPAVPAKPATPTTPAVPAVPEGPPTITSTSTSKLANTIIGNNNGDDCTFVAGDKTEINHVAYTNSCKQILGVYGTFIEGQDLAGQTLIAGNSSVTDGTAVCALPPAAGLLCPFRIYPGQFSGYFLPRLIPSPTATLASQLIVNKGYISGTGIACSSDQRGLARTLCDIGAIELVIPAGNAQANGQDIIFGQIASIDLSPVVGDGQLIPAGYCSTLYGTSAPPQGGVWVDGCVRYVIPPTKGVATYDAVNNRVIYTPSSNFHGFDKFRYTITTSTSFFSEGENNKTITLTTTIKQDPPSGITSKTVGAGGVGVFAVFVLMGLAMRRRLTGGQL